MKVQKAKTIVEQVDSGTGFSKARSAYLAANVAEARHVLLIHETKLVAVARTEELLAAKFKEKGYPNAEELAALHVKVARRTKRDGIKVSSDGKNVSVELSPEFKGLLA